jgi:DHA1 family tetracycline resistance protein-like MFS transporter
VTRLDPLDVTVSGEPAAPAQLASPVSLPAPRRGLAYLVIFASAAIGAGLVRTVATAYLPVLLAEIRDAPGLIGAVMLVNSAAGFAVPLLVGRWSDRRHTPTHGRRPFIAAGSVLAACGMAAVTLGHGTSYLVLTLAGAVAYVGVNVVSTAHRALIHDCFGAREYARANGAQEVAMLAGGILGLAIGGLLAGLALWAPFLLAAVGMPLLAWPTLRWLPVADPGETKRRDDRPLGYYWRTMLRPGVRSLFAAEVLWVIGYAALPVFFILYAKDVLGIEAGSASLWLAAFAVAAGLTMLIAGRIRNPIIHKPFLALGVGLMGLGLLATAASTNRMWVAGGIAATALGFGLIATLGYSLFASLIPRGEAGGYTALYYSLRAVASAISVPLAGLTIQLSGSYRSLFLFGGIATLAALVPLAFAPTPGRAARMTERWQ